jgi:serine/threonine-protein kinase
MSASRSSGSIMALAVGARVGPYEIVSAIGAGGMGEVYRARDTKLKREAALKVLPDQFTLDPDRVARFRREAEVLASLNHPNIAVIYGLEESDGAQAIALELVEGPTLADRIAHGPIPLGEALTIARQIAEALEAAHGQGIIRRDLKPANIKLRPDGTVKVLDFGLAKALEPRSDVRPDVSTSPTITSPAMTGIGVILGTAAYMSPEQAKGRPADKRSDVWAFGCVLFEMLTGTRAFGGEDVSDTLAAVLRGEPAWTAMPADVPRSVRALVRQCLEKNRTARIADMAVARFVLAHRDAFDGEEIAATTKTPRWLHVLPWALAATCATGLIVSLAGWAPWRPKPAAAPQRLSVELGTDLSLANTEFGASAVPSPDGKIVAFVGRTTGSANSQLYVRRLDQLQATPLAGTDDAQSPFFSPDGQWIAFFASGKLKKIGVTGGAAMTLCDAPAGRGGTWGDDGTIVFSPNVSETALQRVSSAGGTPVPLTPEGEVRQARWPQILPGGQAVLFTSSGMVASFNDGDLVVQPLRGGTLKVVHRGGFYGRYVPSGHLLYVHDGTLWAVLFDIKQLAVIAPPVPVIEGVTSNAANGGAQLAVSAGGTLVYVPGQGTSGVPIHWMDREGKTTPLRAEPLNWTAIQFSPDGRRLALQTGVIRNSDVWVHELARDSLTRVTSDSFNARPVWSPDGRRIVFMSNRGNQDAPPNLYWQLADGVRDAERLTHSPNAQFPGSWHPGGKLLAFAERSPEANFDVLILPMEGAEASGWKPGQPTAFLKSRFDEREPTFSPDGRWIAYQSNESGHDEVYVRPFPGPGGKWQISSGGGSFPVWSRTARELFYGTPTQQIMVVPYVVEGAAFRADKPRLWSEGRYRFRGISRPFDLHPDGTRFALAPATPTDTKQDHVTMIFNVFDELRRIAPVSTR